MATVTTAVPTALSVSGLVKPFGRTRALDGQEVAVRRGEVLGFLGRNGAGDASQLDAALRRLSDGGIRSLVSRLPTPEARFLRRYGSGQASAGDGLGTWPGAGR